MTRNSKMNGVLALAGLMMAAASDYSDIYATRRQVSDASIDDQDAEVATVAKPKPKRTLPVNPKTAGLQEFWYDDDFHCWAINQKVADKKHKKWLQSLSD